MIFSTRVGVVAAASLLLGCGHLAADRPAVSGASPTCAAFHPLMDVRMVVNASQSYTGETSLQNPVSADLALGHIHVALRKLKMIPGVEARNLETTLRRLDQVLLARRSALAELWASTKKTHERAIAAMDAAATCQGVDLRDPSKPARTSDRSITAEAAGDRSRVQQANLAIVNSKKCESAVHLWSTARNADLTSDVSAAAVSAQLAEISLDTDRNTIRQELSAALGDHARQLRAIRRLAESTNTAQDAELKELMAALADTTERLNAMRVSCFANMHLSDHIVGGSPDPRRATIRMRPTWPDALRSLPTAGQVRFGSGFLVKWKTQSGQVEMRVVTNHHVMADALAAEVVSGDSAQLDPEPNRTGPAKPRTWSAVLIQANRQDDIAVLRLDKKAESIEAYRHGLSFRLSPAREQEQVVAAGFPGVGSRPSFQVTKGVVSNTRFGAEGTNDIDEFTAFVQHTAPIDPGNSGGPLLDDRGQLLGMNTMKIIGRENVGLAIPTVRIQAAMVRADDPLSFDVKHAEATCNAVLAALSNEHPPIGLTEWFGLAMFDDTERESPTSSKAITYRDRIVGQPDTPVAEARLRVYSVVRATLEQERGVAAFETCSDVHEVAGHKYVASFGTRSAQHQMVLAEDSGAIRVVAVH